jgi:hypothetical protein
MGTAAFVAFLMSPVQPALHGHAVRAAVGLRLASGRVWVGPLAGVLAETHRLARDFSSC